jgi:hypothetical protein
MGHTDKKMFLKNSIENMLDVKPVHSDHPTSIVLHNKIGLKKSFLKEKLNVEQAICGCEITL